MSPLTIPKKHDEPRSVSAKRERNKRMAKRPHERTKNRTTADGRVITNKLPAHGTRARYTHRKNPCHCRRCTEANRLYQKIWHRKKVDKAKGLSPLYEEGTEPR